MADLLDLNGFGKFSRRGQPKSSRLFYLIPLTFLAVVLLSGVSVRAQEEIIPANLAPPAVKAISKDEQTALAAVNDVKDRTRLALEMMESRLKKAEELNTQQSFNALLGELGGFHALMEDAIRFLNRNNNGGGKAMNNFKRFEMALRTFMPRIEILRRDLPDRFEYHVRKLLITVRDTRSRAVEPFFSTTVLPAGN